MSKIMKLASDFLGISSPDNPDDSPPDMKFIGHFDLRENLLNGLEFRGLYIPEEIMVNIFSYLEPSDILKCSLVCKNWHNIAKSNALWHYIYNEKEYPKKAKNLPWYVFYCYYTTDNFKNLIKNGNGQKKFKHWKIQMNGGDKFIVEKEPIGCDPLPVEIPEFNGYRSCFATSFQDCYKYQEVDLAPKRLLRYIIGKYHPILQASEWFAGRFDCAAIYQLHVACVISGSAWTPMLHAQRHEGQRRPINREEPDSIKTTIGLIEQWENKPWEKRQLSDSEYPTDVSKIFFIHGGKDRQFWKGHYGSKMAGGVLRFLFDSIVPTEDDINGIEDNS